MQPLPGLVAPNFLTKSTEILAINSALLCHLLFLYLNDCRRKGIAVAAKDTWPRKNIPTFKNNKENQQKLSALVDKLLPECQLPWFGKEAIRKHILNTLTERRRNIKKGYDYEVCLHFQS